MTVPRYRCPNCNSAKIFLFRLDNDWAYGAGDFTTLNEDEHYTEDELNYDSTDRPDINMHYCNKCFNTWKNSDDKL